MCVVAVQLFACGNKYVCGVCVCVCVWCIATPKSDLIYSNACHVQTHCVYIKLNAMVTTSNRYPNRPQPSIAHTCTTVLTHI